MSEDGNDQIWVGKVTQSNGGEVLFHGTTKGVVRSHIEAFVAEWWNGPIDMWTEDPAEGHSEIGHGEDRGETQEAIIYPHELLEQPAALDEYVFQPEETEGSQ